MAPSKKRKTSKRNSSLADEQEAKLGVYLRDFDVQVKTKKAQLTNDGRILQQEIDKLFVHEKMKMRKDIKQMNFSDYLACGGDPLAVLDIKIGDFEREVSEKARVGAKPPVPVESSSRSKGQIKGKNKNAKQDAAQSSNDTNGPWPTPLFTPKFDPRLPITPSTQTRQPRAGEMLLSKRGSLVVATKKGGTICAPIPEEDEEDVQLIVPLQDGNVIQMSDIWAANEETVPKLDPNTVTKLGSLHRKLGSMLAMMQNN